MRCLIYRFFKGTSGAVLDAGPGAAHLKAEQASTAGQLLGVLYWAWHPPPRGLLRAAPTVLPLRPQRWRRSLISRPSGVTTLWAQ